MTGKQLSILWSDALTSNDRDAFVSDWAMSSIWSDMPGTDAPAGRLAQIGIVWDAAHRTVRDIADASSMSHRQLAERFCVPYRTVEDWCAGRRTPPDYVRLMMQDCLGLFGRARRRPNA